MVLGSQPAASTCPCRVVVKARPTPEGQEDALGHELTLGSADRLLLGREIAADRVYLPAGGNAVYDDEVQPLVSSLFDGFNSTIFAYGASGAGKTHTILGSRQQPGLVHQVADGIFRLYDPRSCAVTVSVEELYCEQFTDLLAPNAAGSLKQAPSNPFNQNTSPFKLPKGGSSAGQAARKYASAKVAVGSAAELKALVQHTLRKRHTASTAINDRSSRSHAIVTISLEQRKQVFGSLDPLEAAEDGRRCRISISGSSSSSSSGDVADTEPAADCDGSECDGASVCEARPSITYLLSQLHLVDLAGSENIKRSGAEGRQQKEAGVINKSLCHLKTVIEEVYKGSKVSTFRNSKLTYKLQDALGGGNSKLLVIACISTARACLGETKETLRFAEMARSITNKPIVNREPKDEIIHRLQQQLEEAEDELRKALRGSGALADQLLQQQLNAVEAAYADLQEEAEANNRLWSSQLAAAYAREAALHQQLEVGRSELAATAAAGSEAAGVLQSASVEVSALRQQVSHLQEQLEQQQATADAATYRAAEQENELLELQQQMLQERQGRRATEGAVQQLLKQLQQQALTMETVATADLDDTSDQNVQEVVAGVCTSLRQHLHELQQQLEEARRREMLQRQQQDKQSLLRSSKWGWRVSDMFFNGIRALHGIRLSPLKRLLVETAAGG